MLTSSPSRTILQPHRSVRMVSSMCLPQPGHKGGLQPTSKLLRRNEPEFSPCLDVPSLQLANAIRESLVIQFVN